MAVKEDVIAGSSARVTKDGKMAVRVFTVTSISGSTASGVLLNAVLELRAANVFIGKEHPDDGELSVVDIFPEPLGKGNNQARVTVTYKTADNSEPQIPDQPIVRFNGTVIGVTTNFDRDGTIIKVAAPAGFQGRDQIGQVADDKAVGILTADWITSSSPKWLIKYTNKMNASAWFGEPKWSWWISSVGITRQYGTGFWRIALEARLDEELVTAAVCYRDPITNQIPETVAQKVDKSKLGPVAGKGVTVIARKFEKDFGKLPIPQSALG